MKGSRMRLVDTVKHYDFMFAVCTFLDDFRKSEKKDELIQDEPINDNIDKVNLCLLAAIAHRLANENNLAVPSWVTDSTYKMPYPVYAHDTKNKEYQQYLIETTPDEFAIRNIFYGSNVIERV